MTAKGVSAPLCSTPQVVPFEFHQAQEMHSEITITNQVDSEVTFKIKTNKPGLYLVKPMEGRLLRKDKMKISFKRKELPLQDYLAIVKNPNLNKEKFLIELNSEVVNNFGLTQNCQQSSYLGVKFTSPSVTIPRPIPNNPQNQPNTNIPNVNLQSPPKITNIPNIPNIPTIPNIANLPNLFIANTKPTKPDWQKIIAEKKRELQSQVLTKESLLLNVNKEEPSQNEFKLTDLINLLLIAFLLGFII